MFDERLNKKEKLILLGFLILSILLSIWMEIDYHRSVEECVSGGQDRQICETGLR